jgi:hypothetical protein
VHQDEILGRAQPTRALKVVTKGAWQHENQAHQAAPGEFFVLVHGRDIHAASLSYGNKRTHVLLRLR